MIQLKLKQLSYASDDICQPPGRIICDKIYERDSDKTSKQGKVLIFKQNPLAFKRHIIVK